MNRASSAEARSRALNATLAFIQCNLRPLLRVQAAGLQHFGRIMHHRAARFTNESHQSLRQDAIQRRNKVVWLDAHVQKASNHVDHVIGVDGGEHQVSGEGGINGDLRGFHVADFAHHDLVGVMTQNRTQSAGKRQPLLLVDRNLRDAAQLVFHRIFNRNDLVFVGLDLVHGCVQRCGFAAARRAGDQHHAVRLFDVAPELAQVLRIETHNVQREGSKLLAHRLFIEYAEHGIFAVNRRHDRDAEVDGAPVIAHSEAPVLRHAPLGNIQLAHHLDARDDGRMVFLANRRHGL